VTDPVATSPLARRRDLRTGTTGRPRLDGRVRVDGKQFAVGDERFVLRGVTYGTFRPRADGERYPDPVVLRSDLATIAAAGFTALRTYTAPSDDLVEAAEEVDLRLLAGAFWPDWRYLVGCSRRQRRRMLRDARDELRGQVARRRDSDRILAWCLGNEVPADVVRWEGTDRVRDALDELADEVRDVDPGALVTYATYPTSEYLLPAGTDFPTVNVYLEDRQAFRRYLNRLHTLAGDRPLVLGEVGLTADGTPRGEREQAEALDWLLETSIERGVAGTFVFSFTDDWWVGDQRVEGWHFGLTDRDRQARPAMAVAGKWNRAGVRDLEHDWPTMSVVICAYNAAATLDECLRHTCALDYPGLEVIVVDDGSTDDTAAIARRHPGARLLELPHGGLSVARNAGAAAAAGELVVYLDSDAYPSPEWPWYLALGLDGPTVGGVGGPNVPPADDGPGAQLVARAPGGPVHVLVGDDRAEHVPGCNMAFWRSTLAEVGGFDPVYHAAGDDVDVCWKVLDAGWDLAFHPAALVWHHRRTGLRPYLRQQVGYGKAEALVAARHPDRFTPAGTARWRGRIYTSLPPVGDRDRIYRGVFGTAPFQSVYRGGGHGLDLAHQVGVPVAVALLPSALAAALSPWLALPAAAAVTFLVVLGCIDARRTTVPAELRRGRVRFRAGVALHHLAQPLARWWGRRRHRGAARRDLDEPAPLPGPVERVRGGVLLLPAQQPRAEMVRSVIAALRQEGTTVCASTGWEAHDARLVGSFTLDGHLLSSAYPEGAVQFRVDPAPRPVRIVALAAVAAALAVVTPFAAGAVVAATAADLAVGRWRTAHRTRRTIRELAR
jgi:glycosyltransferase involved in cell wall biosynthesis